MSTQSQKHNESYTTISQSSSQSTSASSSNQSNYDQNAQNENKCMMLIRNCLGVIFPQLLEGLTHPDQRDQLPSRKKKDKKQYHRVSNPGEEDDDEDEDEESKVGSKQENGNNNNDNEDQNEFFNEFQSWRSNQKQQNNKNSNSGTEMQDMKSQKNNSRPQQKSALLTLSENEIEQQKNMIQDGTGDDLFKDFNQKQQQQRKLPAPPQNNRMKASPRNSANNKLNVESKAPQLTDLFSELETSLGSQQQQQQQQQMNNNDQQDQFNINMGSDGMLDNKNVQQQNQDILEEKGWDEEININIE